VSKIVVVGAGYVGLVTGACLAQKGKEVVIVENNQSKIQLLLLGQIPFYEPGLDNLVQENIKNGRLSFVSDMKIALGYAPEAIFLCVGTPSMPDGSADLSFVWHVAIEIGKTIKNYCVVINKSTVPVGTACKVKQIIKTQLKERGLTIDFDVASNPEFLKEGDALSDFLYPDRIVIGVENSRSENVLRKIYQSVVQKADQFLVMNLESSEMSKYASNAMLATRISFMNQMALLAEKVGADINSIKQAMSLDKRIGPYFLNAGVGYGGSCFPKDVRALVATGEEYEQPMTLVAEVEKVNVLQRNWFLQKIFDYYGYSILGKNVGIWGISFKPETDDIRCAPSIDVIQNMLERKVNIFVYDPVALENVRNVFGNKINYANTSSEILNKSDFLIILTEWKEFLSYKPESFCRLNDKVVFDGRNCFDPENMFAAGIKYFDIGRAQAWQQQNKKFLDEFENIEINQI
jgi:UDPglucose 6-dehydrogenase